MKRHVPLFLIVLLSGCARFSDLPATPVKEEVPLQREWVTSKGETFYLDSAGEPVKGWQEIEGSVYFFDRSTGALNLNGEWELKEKLNQQDTRWRNLSYGGYTVGGTGCAEMTMGMVVQGYGQDIEMETLFALAYENGWNNYELEGYTHPYGTLAETQVRTMEALGFHCYPASSAEELQTLLDHGLVFIGGFRYTKERPISSSPNATHAVIIYQNRLIDPMNQVDGEYYTAEELWERQSQWPGDAYQGTTILGFYPV